MYERTPYQPTLWILIGFSLCHCVYRWAHISIVRATNHIHWNVTRVSDSLYWGLLCDPDDESAHSYVLFLCDTRDFCNIDVERVLLWEVDDYLGIDHSVGILLTTNEDTHIEKDVFTRSTSKM